MARRRSLSFRAYARRRWRIVGLTLVAMAATLLLFSLIDRGHEPLWRDEPTNVDTVQVSEDGRTVLALREVDGALMSAHAFDSESGEELWARPLNLSEPAIVAAGSDWFAVATPFPGAKLLAFHARGGNVLHDEFLPGEPRGLAADGDRLAVALRSGLVIVYDGFQVVRSHPVSPLVSTMDFANDRVAVGTSQGTLTVIDASGVLVNASRPLQIQTLRLSDDGTRLVVGGRVLRDGDLSGGVEYFDLASARPDEPTWTTPTRARVSLTGMSADGRYVLAMEESLPRYAIHYFDAATGAGAVWSRTVDRDDSVFRNDPGQAGGVALSPDGMLVALGTVTGGVTAIDATSGVTLWTYAAQGVTSVSFSGTPGDPRFASNARLVPNYPYDAVLLFDAFAEPVWALFPAFPLALVALEAVVGSAVLVGAYWWYRRT